MLAQRAGITMQHINYNGSGPAVTDLIAGRVSVMFDIWHASKRFVDAGDLKLIAGASAERLTDAPQVRSIAETYPGFDATSSIFMIGPANMPLPVLEKLSADIRGVVESAEFAEKTRALGINAKGTTPQETDARIRREIAHWAGVVKAAGIKID